MAKYNPPLSRRAGNIIYAKDGTAWVNFIIDGINVNPYSSNVVAYQDAHERFFNALSTLPSNDFLLLGFKTRTDPREIMAKCTRGIPDWRGPNNEPGWAEKTYPVLHKMYSGLWTKLCSDPEYFEYKRRFWLSIGVPLKKSMLEKALREAAVTDPHAEVDENTILEFEARCRSALAEFNPIPTHAGHVDYIYDRVRLRGVEVPIWNESDRPFQANGREYAYPGPPRERFKYGEKSYPPVDYDFAVDHSLLYEDFLSAVSKMDSTVMKSANKIFKGTYRSTVKSTAVSLTSTDDHTAEMPAGLTSYQSLLAVSRYPATPTTDLNSYTYLVDQPIGVDADFALRFSFPKHLVSQAQMSESIRNINVEDESNSKDELEASNYERKREALRRWHRAVNDEANPVGMKVTAIFAFADANLEVLRSRVESIRTLFASKRFTTTHTAAGQGDLWKMMMPGAPTSALGRELAADTTIHMFSPFMPLRVSKAGDDFGIPLMRNRENALGGFIFYDMLNATDKGNASMEATGAQNAGKTNWLKYLLALLHALNRHAYVIDQSNHGEYEVFVSQLPGARPQIVDVTGANRKVSLDVLKCFPPHLAAQIFLDLWLPIMGLEPDSKEATLLSRILAPEYRETYSKTAVAINSTRDLINHLGSGQVHGGEAEVLHNKLDFWAKQPYTAAFIDPISYGQVVDIPPFNPKSNVVIFRTSGLSVYQGEDLSKATTSQKFAALALTAIARLTAEQFLTIRGAAALIGDEMHFLKGSNVLSPLIKQQDRTARKEGKFVLVGSQLAEDQDENYALIKKRLALKQEVQENAVGALIRIGLPPTQNLVNRMLTDTTPSDPNNNNYPMAGRHGEGWYNDGNGNIVRIQTLPQLLEALRRSGDTTSSKMIRAEDLRAQEEGFEELSA